MKNSLYILLLSSFFTFAEDSKAPEVISPEKFFEMTPEEQQAIDPRYNPYMNGTNPEELEKLLALKRKKQEAALLPPGAPIRVLPSGKSKEEEDKYNEAVYLLRRQEFRINSEYRAGKFLIYDCELKNFVCVNIDSYKICENKRAMAIEKGALFYPCAPLKEFISKQICLYKNYEVMKRESEKKFCYKIVE